jgi:AraC family transcriptional regulator of adaptative response / DNA-3-methyladenine glycosylase II
VGSAGGPDRPELDLRLWHAGHLTADSAQHERLLRLPFQQPFSPESSFGHLAATGVPGVEEVRHGAYRRTLRLPHGPGIVELTPQPDHVACHLSLTDPGDLAIAVSRCRWLLDLDAEPEPIDRHLAADQRLHASVQRAPGRRIPRSVDGGELALRAVIGQQVSTAAARTHAGRLATEWGDPVTDPRGGLTRLFPTPAALEGVRLAMPESRNRTFAALVAALSSGQLSLDPRSDTEEAVASLGRIRGIGPWTTAIIAMRALGDPDAFPASDLGVRRGAEALGLPADPRSLAAHGEAWRPWRAYAAQHLWAATPHAINLWPPEP